MCKVVVEKVPDGLVRHTQQSLVQLQYFFYDNQFKTEIPYMGSAEGMGCVWVCVWGGGVSVCGKYSTQDQNVSHDEQFEFIKKNKGLKKWLLLEPETYGLNFTLSLSSRPSPGPLYCTAVTK